MDSCNLMRGSKNGLEKQIKEKPNLLDIGEDSCHHFDAHLELLFINIYNDFK